MAEWETRGCSSKYENIRGDKFLLKECTQNEWVGYYFTALTVMRKKHMDEKKVKMVRFQQRNM